MKPLTPGVFRDLGSEQLKYILTPDKEGVQIGVYSTLTGERLASGASIPHQKKWEVEQMIKEFIDETEAFIESYFGENETIKGRAVDFDQVLNDLRFMLKRAKKGLPTR